MTNGNPPEGPQGRPTAGGSLRHAVVVFAIGFFATLCATILPRLIAGLSLTGESGYLDFFKGDFAVAVAVLAGLVGLAMVIFEWSARHDPRHIFIQALGAPALITGIYSTTGGAADFARASAERDAAARSLLEASNVAIERPPAAVKLRLLTPRGAEQRSGLDPALSLIAPARAQEGAPGASGVAEGAEGAERAEWAEGPPLTPRRGFDPGVARESPGYVIVLAKAATAAAALDRAAALKTRVPTAWAAGVGDSFYVLAGPEPLPFAKAGIEAFKIKGDLPAGEPTPMLLEVK